MTRKWRDHKSLVQLVCLFLIDEVHQLNDEVRGPTVEAIVSRMKTIRAAAGEGGDVAGGRRGGRLRFIAVSATIPNITDVSSVVHLIIVHCTFLLSAVQLAGLRRHSSTGIQVGNSTLCTVAIALKCLLKGLCSSQIK